MARAKAVVALEEGISREPRQPPCGVVDLRRGARTYARSIRPGDDLKEELGAAIVGERHVADIPDGDHVMTTRSRYGAIHRARNGDDQSRGTGGGIRQPRQ
jgi:hypothetical protein